MTDKEGSMWYSWMGKFRDERHFGLDIDSYIDSYLKNAKRLYSFMDDITSKYYVIYDNGIVLSFASEFDVPSITDINDPDIQQNLGGNLIEDIKNEINEIISDKEFEDLYNAFRYKENLRDSYDTMSGTYLDSDTKVLDKIRHLFNRAFFLNIKNIEDASDVKKENNVKTSIISYIKHKDKDGFVIKDTIDSNTQKGLTDVYAVRYSNQIKSAIDNTGEFSRENDDIRYSSTEELTITTASSFLDAQSQLPIELRSNFASMVDSAAIRSQCK